MDDDQVFETALEIAREEGFSEAQAVIVSRIARSFFKWGRRSERRDRKRRKGQARQPRGRARLTAEWFPAFMVYAVRELKQTHPDLKTDSERIEFFLSYLRKGEQRDKRRVRDQHKPMKLPPLKQAKGIYVRELARQNKASPP